MKNRKHLCPFVYSVGLSRHLERVAIHWKNNDYALNKILFQYYTEAPFQITFHLIIFKWSSKIRKKKKIDLSGKFGEVLNLK